MARTVIRAEVDVAEIRIRAERRLGEMMREQKETVTLNRGLSGSIVTGFERDPVMDSRPTLTSVGIDKNLADRVRKTAAVPAEEFESIMDDWRERIAAEGERVTAEG